VTALPAPHLPLHCFRDENPLWIPCLCSVLADRKPFVRRRKPGSVRATNTSETGWRAIRPTRRKNRQIGKSGESTWQNRGGHRLWVAPEAPPDSPITYAADNFPVKIKLKAGTIEATPPLEREAGLQKQMVLKMAASGSGVEVLHRITNKNAWTIELAAWGLTVLSPGGVGITRLPPRGTHPEMLAPTNPLVIWAFTDLSDKRWQFTGKYILLRQDSKIARPQKIGSFNKDTFGAYYLANDLFVKRYQADLGKTYPDMGASFEMFANAEVLELETLGPLTRLAPGESLQHLERWSLHRNVKIGKWTDAELDRVLTPLVS